MTKVLSLADTGDVEGRADGKGKIRGSLWNRMTQRQKPGSECPLGN